MHTQIDQPLKVATNQYVRRAWEQNPKEVEHWLKERYPKVRSEAKGEEAEIHRGD